MPRSRTTLAVDVLAYDGCFGSEIFTLADLLHIGSHAARHLNGTEGATFDVRIVAARNGPVRTATGGELDASRSTRRTDLFVVPGFDLMPVSGLDARLADLRPEVTMIRRVAKRMPVAAVCVGAFLLGEAGLLDGRRVTTAWLFADRLARRYPAAFVIPSAMILEDNGVTTTAAFSAASDLATSLVEAHGGGEAARLSARITLTGDRRTTQTPYVDPSLLQRRTTSFSADVRTWLASHIGEPYDLAKLAAAFHVSTRTLLRRIKEETGSSPLQQLQQMRIARAKQLLETTTQPLQEVIGKVGYVDQAAFRKLFRTHTDMSPSAYRQRFLARR